MPPVDIPRHDFVRDVIRILPFFFNMSEPDDDEGFYFCRAETLYIILLNYREE